MSRERSGVTVDHIARRSKGIRRFYLIEVISPSRFKPGRHCLQKSIEIANGIEEMATALAQGVTVDHIARQSKDIRRLADFYIETFGFEEVESPKIGPLRVIWLVLPSGFTMHLIECNPSYPPNQRNDTSPEADPARIPRGHHMCFSVSNFETFVQKLKEKGIPTAHRPVQYNPNGSTKIDQIFLFDPDGNALEVSDSAAV